MMITDATLNTTAMQRFGLIEKVLLCGALVSASLLIGAHIFEYLGYAPCALCLDQREAHWTALTITVIGLVISFLFKVPRLAAAATGTAALVYGFSAALAFYHTGIEFSFWPGPASCTGIGNIGDAGNLSLDFDPDIPRVSCTNAAWRLFGISMAGYNLLLSAGLFALTFFAATHALRKAKREKRV